MIIEICTRLINPVVQSLDVDTSGMNPFVQFTSNDHMPLSSMRDIKTFKHFREDLPSGPV